MDAFNHRFHRKLINLPNLHQIIHYSPLTISPDSCVMDAINLMNQQQDHAKVQCYVCVKKRSISTDLLEQAFDLALANLFRINSSKNRFSSLRRIFRNRID